MTDCQLIEMMLLIRKHRAKRVSVHEAAAFERLGEQLSGGEL
jgi:hypothetical protein